MALSGRRPVGPRHAIVSLNAHHPWHVVHSGYTALVTNQNGAISGRGREGLWHYETRVLSRWRALIDGRAPAFNVAGAVESDRWRAHLCLPRSGGDAEGPLLPQDTLELAVDRRVARGMEEQLRVTNHSMAPLEAELTIELDADFADMQETALPREQHGRVDISVASDLPGLVFDYRAARGERTLRRAIRVRVAHADSGFVCDGRRLRFRLDLPPRGRWDATVRYEPLADGRWRTPAEESPASTSLGGTMRDRIRDRWRKARPRLEGAYPIVGPAFEQAADDLFSLRNQEIERETGHWVVNAGLPVYLALFGRDVLTASWQGAVIGAEFARGALEAVAETQAREDSAWRDEEPGKMIHEMHRGPLSELGIRPLDAYYGTQTTPAMFVLVLSEAWHWTGDESLLRRHRDAALRSFGWAERYGDRDGDGFLEYDRPSSRGGKNHGWKDSDEAIRYDDGTLTENPIATVEEQAYHFVAFQRMAEILIALNEEGRAEAFLEKAHRLRERWERAYWMEDERFYAMALDPDKRQVRSIGSNAGHALAAGMVRRDRAQAVADRLLASDMFSGWGVRTLSTDHPSYNPFSYHLGAVWPVENATFALGMKRYGLDDHAERIIAAQFAAAAYFHAFRLPEALGGHSREEAPFPTLYPQSNSPQAWSASATIQYVQVMLGLYPFAPARTLAVVRPRLPEWLPGLTLRRLRVGDATVSLRFERQRDGTTAYEVVEREGRLLVTDVAPPQDLQPDEEGMDEKLKEWMLEHAPGRSARAVRIALGMTP